MLWLALVWQEHIEKVLDFWQYFGTITSYKILFLSIQCTFICHLNQDKKKLNFKTELVQYFVFVYVLPEIAVLKI